jgi:hypothetical protein
MAKFGFDNSVLSHVKAFNRSLNRAGIKGASKRTSVRGRTNLTSEQHGCLPHQVEEANDNCKRMNIAAEYQPDGSVRYGGVKAEREHQRALERALSGNI